MNRSDGLERSNHDHARSWEARMRVVPALWLAAAFAVAGPAHAQGCAGGSGGGADATGNECSDSATVAMYTAEFDAVPPLNVASTGKLGHTRAHVVSAVHAKTSGTANAPKLAAQRPRQIATAGPPRANSAHAPSVEAGIATPCSGGSYGGMDMTGNQCGDYPAADTSVRQVYASRR